MPKAVISGYYGFHNCGDEAILFAMLQALKKAAPDLEVTVLSRKPEYTSREFGVASVSRDNPWAVFQALRKADMLISGGGGLLQDVTSPRSIIYYLGVISMAVLLGKPVFCYAQGIGPVRTTLGRKGMRLVVNRVQTITVRDEDSRQELWDLGVKRPEILVTADPVLGLERSAIDREQGRRILAAIGLAEGNLVGISVIPRTDLSRYKEVLARVADDLAGTGRQVLLIPMHNPVDVEPCQEVAGLMDNRATILDGNIGYRELLAVIANLDLAVGMRLHFLIFSAICGVPFVGISYDPKINSFLRLMGQTADLSVNDLDYAKLAHQIKKVLGNPDAVKTSIEAKVSRLRHLALTNAELTGKMLK